MRRHLFRVMTCWRELSTALAFALLMCPSNIAMAAGESEGHLTYMVTPRGGVDWTTGVATATGIGVPPKNPASALQAREMTRTAAWSVALRNLLEVVNGLYLDSTTTVNNFVTVNADVRTKVEGMVQGAKVVKEQELPTGEFETTVEMKVGGKLSELLVPKTEQRTGPLDSLKNNADKNSTLTANPAAPGEAVKRFTGLVVDARGTGANPAIAPRLLTTDGQEAYGSSYVDRSGVDQVGDERNRIAWYVSNENAAKAHAKVASNPLIVKALRAEGPNRTDLVIHDADAQLIQLRPEHFVFLKQAKVLVILDELPMR